MINKIQLIGRIGKDSETKETQKGNVTTFSLATSESRKVNHEWQEFTTWHNIIHWKDKSFKKGQLIYIEGKQVNRQYQDKDGNNRLASEVVAYIVRPLEKLEPKPEPKDYPKDNNNNISDDLPF